MLCPDPHRNVADVVKRLQSLEGWLRRVCVVPVLGVALVANHCQMLKTVRVLKVPLVDPVSPCALTPFVSATNMVQYFITVAEFL